MHGSSRNLSARWQLATRREQVCERMLAIANGNLPLTTIPGGFNRISKKQPVQVASELRDTVFMWNTDSFPPELMQELLAARRPLGGAYDQLWRRERLFRYSYWLDHGHRPSFNFVGSWKEADMRAELQLWRGLRSRGGDEVDAISEITRLFENRFGLSVESATSRATNPELARKGLPIWNAASECLVPQNLGPWRIAGMSANEPSLPGLGQSYFYRGPTEDTAVTMYLYDQGLEGITAELTDPRFAQIFGQALADIEQASRARSEAVEWLTEPLMEVVRSAHGAEIPFASTTWSIIRPQGPRQVGALSITGFYRQFLKIRLTGSESHFDTEEGQAEVTAFNLALADFVEEFGTERV